MPTNTTNYNLVKPTKATDNADIDVVNNNMDIIDSTMKANADAAAAAQSSANTAQSTANAAQVTANAAIPASQKGAASGVAPLDSSSLVPSANLPKASGSALGAVKVGTGINEAPDGTISTPANAISHGPSLTALMHFESALLSTRGLAATFTRASAANNPETLAPLAANQPAYVTGKFGKAIQPVEGTTNLVYNSDFETVTGTATVFSDPLTSYSGSSAAPWAVQSGSFAFGASGATSGATSSLITAGNNAWKPLTGSGGQNLALTAQATITTPSSLSANNNGTVRLQTDANNYYQAYIDNGYFYLSKSVGGTYSNVVPRVAQTIAANTTYTITLSRDTAGVLTAKLYSGTGTGGTLLQTLTATDTSLSGGFLVGVGGDTGVVISGVSVKAPWADGWTITNDARGAWALSQSAISGSYSLSVVGVGSGVTVGVYQSLAVSTSTSYTLSSYINTSNVGTGGAWFEFDNTSSNPTLPKTSVVTGTASTQRYSVSATSGPSATSGSVVFRLADGGKAIFDAIQLEAKSYATAYVQNNSTITSATRAAETLTLGNSPLSVAAGTVAMWAYDSGISGVNRYLLSMYNSGHKLLMRRGDTSNAYELWVNGVALITKLATGYSAGWHHFAFNWNGLSVSFYIDGVSVGSYTLSQAPQWQNTLYVGSYQGGVYQWNNPIDELAIFNRALTDAEVYSLYAATQPLIDVFASDAQTLAGLTPAQITTNIPNTALTGPLVSSVTGNNGITVSNPTGVGAATLGLSGVPNSALAGPQVSSLTAGQNISVSNPGGVGAATVGLSGVVPVANGGTGSATQNFVDLSSTQTVGGAKTFNNGVSVNNGLAVNSGGATVYSGADFGLQAAVGSPNDAGDIVFRNYDGTTRARVHAGVGSTPQLTLNAGGTDRVTIDNSGNMSVQNTISFGGSLITMNTDLNLNGPSSTYASTAASVKVGSILATDNYGEARPSGEGHIAAKYGMTVGGNTVWHAGNASGGAWVWELFQGRVYATTNSSTSGNTDYSYDTGTSAGGAVPTGGSLNYKFLWQAGLATGKSVYFEALIEGGTGTAYCALKDLTTSTLYGQVSTTANGLPGTRVRSGAISLVDGHEYAIALWGTGSGTIMTEARLIII